MGSGGRQSEPARSAPRTDYRGRFAPSPTGPLHLGSLVAAVASYLQARRNQGQWLVRIEDIDPPRQEPGATEQIIRSLERHGFEWDAPVSRQGESLQRYTRIANRLLQEGRAYRCVCSREDIRRLKPVSGPAGLVYPGTCRHRHSPIPADEPAAIRLKTSATVVEFTDRLQGPIRTEVAATIGDFVIQRKDGLPAYHLATVVDDARTGITEIVRGCDLLDVTPAQIVLQESLELPTPAYMHVPVVVNDRGQKLSKRTGARALDDNQAGRNLVTALDFLGQTPEMGLAGEPLTAIWQWAVSRWNPEKSTQGGKRTRFLSENIFRK